MSAVRTGAAAVLAACGLAGAAHAQTVESAPFVIHDVPVDGAVKVAKRNEPVLAQPVTGGRAARLDAEAPTLFKSKSASFPAGAAMFGTYDHASRTWLYCAVAESKAKWWSGDEFACYEDGDSDGRFDSVRPSGSPFLGVPLFVFTPGAAKPLPTPVPYSRAAYDTGPRTEYALRWSVERPRAKSDAPRPKATSVTVSAVMGPYDSPIGAAASAKLDANETGLVKFKGAEIEVLGFEPDGSLRYRVLKPMPRQIGRVTMTMTTSTTYVPIYVPAG